MLKIMIFNILSGVFFFRGTASGDFPTYIMMAENQKNIVFFYFSIDKPGIMCYNTIWKKYFPNNSSERN